MSNDLNVFWDQCDAYRNNLTKNAKKLTVEESLNEELNGFMFYQDVRSSRKFTRWVMKMEEHLGLFLRDYIKLQELPLNPQKHHNVYAFVASAVAYAMKNSDKPERFAGAFGHLFYLVDERTQSLKSYFLTDEDISKAIDKFGESIAPHAELAMNRDEKREAPVFWNLFVVSCCKYLRNLQLSGEDINENNFNRFLPNNVECIQILNDFYDTMFYYTLSRVIDSESTDIEKFNSYKEKIAELEDALSFDDDLIRELRSKNQQLEKKVSDYESEDQSAEIQKLKNDLAKRDAHIKALEAQLELAEEIAEDESCDLDEEPEKNEVPKETLPPINEEFLKGLNLSFVSFDGMGKFERRILDEFPNASFPERWYQINARATDCVVLLTHFVAHKHSVAVRKACKAKNIPLISVENFNIDLIKSQLWENTYKKEQEQ